jgi:hypothetical protein
MTTNSIRMVQVLEATKMIVSKCLCHKSDGDDKALLMLPNVAQKEGVLEIIGVSHNSTLKPTVVKPDIFDKSSKVHLKFDCLSVG